MQPPQSDDGTQGSPATLTDLVRHLDEAALSILGTLLDAHLLFGEAALPKEEFQTLFEVWWPERPLEESLKDLGDSQLLTVHPGPVYAVMPTLRPALAKALNRRLANYTVRLPHAALDYEALLAAFARYTREDLPEVTPQSTAPEHWERWTFDSTGRTHHLLPRPFPLRLHAHAESFILLLGQLPPAPMESINAAFVHSPALRQRLAFYDLARGAKINLTKSDVFVYFERYLRRQHGLRIVPAPAF
ncbi:MAG: hypothetical protein JSW39_06875, partial [Desulfobacterales bacterium]